MQVTHRPSPSFADQRCVEDGLGFIDELLSCQWLRGRHREVPLPFQRCLWRLRAKDATGGADSHIDR